MCIVVRYMYVTINLNSNTDNNYGIDDDDDEGGCCFERQPLFFVEALSYHPYIETKIRSCSKIAVSNNKTWSTYIRCLMQPEAATWESALFGEHIQKRLLISAIEWLNLPLFHK